MCVVKLKAISLLVGAVIASSFLTQTKYGTGNRAAAADAEPSVAKGSVTVPEFVPVVNFSEFVLATQQFASENSPSGREAAEALSAKFASASDGQRVELHEAQPLPTPAIVTSALSIPVPDPSGRPEEYLADPVKSAGVVQEDAAGRASAAPGTEEENGVGEPTSGPEAVSARDGSRRDPRVR